MFTVIHQLFHLISCSLAVWLSADPLLPSPVGWPGRAVLCSGSLPSASGACGDSAEGISDSQAPLRRVFISTHEFSHRYSLGSLPHPTRSVWAVAGVEPRRAGKIVNLLHPLLLFCLLSLIKPHFNTRDRKITPQNALLSLEEIGGLFSI